MKYRTWAMIAFYSVLFGWFPFMWIAVFASWNREFGEIVLYIGLFFCIIGSMLMLPIMRNNDLFKSIEELQEERAKWYEARKKLENKIMTKIFE